MELDAADLWDRFERARDARPALDPATFVDEQNDLRRQPETTRRSAVALIEAALDVEALRPSAPIAATDGSGGGHAFAGHRLVRELGRGAFGVVFEAVPPGGGAAVALKLLNPMATVDPRRQRELLREAEVARRLEHPGIVRVLDSGIERGTAWFATELVRGRALDRLPEPTTDSERSERALTIGLALAEAIGHAHALGVVHRDLKPANVLVTGGARVKVLDFGLARHDEIPLSITTDGEVAGTPLFMAPEQLAGGPVGPWSDVFALGLLIVMLADPRVRERLRASDEMSRRIAGARSAAVRLGDLPRPLRAIVRRCLEPHPADRYANAGELAEDLRAAIAGARLPHGYPSTRRRVARWVRRNPAIVAAQAFTLLGLALLVYELWWMAPVPVRFESYTDGKTLLVDGVERGTTPFTTALRPGTHRWTTVASGPAGNGAAYSGSFTVAARAGARNLFLGLDYAPVLPIPKRVTDQEDAVLAELEAVPSGEGAWIALVANAQGGARPRQGRDDVTISAPVRFEFVESEGPVSFRTDTGPIDVHCANLFRLPTGHHRVRISADGHRAREVDLDVPPGPAGDRLQLVTVPLDPIDSPWHTVTLYAPLESRVARWVVETDNVRVFNESEALPELARIRVHKPYWGLVDSTRPGRVVLRVPLPRGEDGERLPIHGLAPPPRIGGGQNTGHRGWIRLSMGASPDEMRTVRAFAAASSSNLPPDLRAALDAHREAGERPNTLRIEPDPDDLAAIAAELGGSDHLWLRWDLGPAPVSDTVSYVSALRSEGLPRFGLSDAEVLWLPALELRLRIRE